MASANRDYGREVLAIATGNTASHDSDAGRIDYGAGWQVELAGVVGDVVVEFEHRDGKPVRGAVLDLICHPCPRKLLVLIPANIGKIDVAAAQCRNIFARFCSPGSFQVVVFTGTAAKPEIETDAAILAPALQGLAAADI